jgi:site-specific DNA-cytosine methylase
MNVLSLFDGIGTGKLMLDMAGIKVDKYYASEIDENAILICKKNHPEVIEIGDVEKINLENLDKIDLLIGGSPCQGFSRNGKMLNFKDERSKLFFVFANTWKKIKEINPNAKFILENVRMKKEYQNIITNIMEVEPIIIDSRIHSGGTRERTYWQNINQNIKQPPQENINLIDILDKVDTNNYILKDGILFDPDIQESERNIVSFVDGEVRIKQATKRGYRE